MPFARSHGKDISGTICNGLIALPHNEDAIEHQSSNIIIVHMFCVCWLWNKHLDLYLGEASGFKFSFEGILIHATLPITEVGNDKKIRVSSAGGQSWSSLRTRPSPSCQGRAVPRYARAPRKDWPR